jgi:hypothetical protein
MRSTLFTGTLATLLAGLVASAAAAAVDVQQQPNGLYYTLVHGGGASDLRYDLVLVGDGFTADEQDEFDARVEDVVAALEARAPFSDRMCAFNVWRVNVVSEDSGVDHPADGVFVDTELDVRYGDPDDGEAERCITSDSPADVYEAAGFAPEHDAIFVLANDTQWGGCAGDLVFSSISAGFAASSRTSSATRSATWPTSTPATSATARTTTCPGPAASPRRRTATTTRRSPTSGGTT